jgi:hypothetical protein
MLMKVFGMKVEVVRFEVLFERLLGLRINKQTTGSRLQIHTTIYSSSQCRVPR